jgi:spore coat protein A, manganese oxidase
MMRATKQLGRIGKIVSFGLAVSLLLGVQLLFAQILDPTSLTKYVDELPVPAKLDGTSSLQIGMYQITQQLHSELLPTTVWAYGTDKDHAYYPGPTIEAVRGIPTHVRWTNNLDGVTYPIPVDKSLHWADPLNEGHVTDRPQTYTGPVPTVVHLHGGETESASDGHPDAWFTPGFAIKGKGWVHEEFVYDNQQPPTTLWYHDHALGVTRLNVTMGLAAFYLLRDPVIEGPLNLPTGAYEREIVIQDRMFNEDGSFFFIDPNDPEAIPNPDVHPNWGPEFFGNVIVVNGKVWPKFTVEPRKYRLRLLNGSNARFYNLHFENGLEFDQIATDGGYLPTPVRMSSLLMAPGERADIIVDFSGNAGENFLLLNSAKEPFPDGDDVDPAEAGQIMQIRVTSSPVSDPSSVPTTLNTIPDLKSGIIVGKRSLTLNEIASPDGPLAAVLDGKMWDSAISELPTLGTTEIWEVINTTGDTHPIHLHLTQFQVLNRQPFDVDGYLAEYESLNPVLPTDNPIKPELEDYLDDPVEGPADNEHGWKDTIQMSPGEVTRIVVRFQPTATPLGGTNDYPFDATAGPGYVWHCHILEHEDNEMMRPYKLIRAHPDYVFLANEKVKIDRNAESDGDIHSNGKIEFGIGAPGTHTGNLTAVDDITIRTKNTIVGDAKAGDDLYVFGNAKVTGAKAKHANVAIVPLPRLSFTAGGKNFTVDKGRSKTLQPGSYNTVKVKANGTLYLSSGDYYMNIFDTDAGATLSIDVSDGPANIFVVTELDLSSYVKVLITAIHSMGGSGATTHKLTFVTLQDPKVDIGKYAQVQGTLIAQDAEVHFNVGGQFKGSVMAEKITLDANVTFMRHDSPRPFSKATELADAEEDNSASEPMVDYELAQNYPNPFNPSTTISFALQAAGEVKLAVYDLSGQLIKTLVAGNLPAGRHNVIWNATNENGGKVASGVYFYKLAANGFVSQKKLVLMK